MNASNQGLASYKFDVLNEKIFPLSELADRISFRRNGKKIHKSTVFRWTRGRIAQDGSLVVIPTIFIGGTISTSLGAYEYFCTQMSSGGGRPSAAQVSEAGSKAAERASRELELAGI